MRIMLEPLRAAPAGWTVVRGRDEMIEALRDVDPVQVVRASVACAPTDAVAVASRLQEIARSAFHLMGGTDILEGLDFHHADVEEAGTAMDAVRGALPSDTIRLVRRVPLGDDHCWWPEKGIVMLAGTLVPDTAQAALIGRPIGRLVSSPLLDEARIITGFRLEDACTLIDLEDDA